MKPFEYAHPTTLKQAVDLLGSDGSEVIAGGTDLLSLMKDFVVQPTRLVSLAGVRELGSIEVDGDQVRIGAMVTLDQLLESEVARRFPALAHAAAGIRSPQMRTMGTVGGELLQRPRCWYFRRGHGLLATREGKSMPEAGDNRYHAIFGNAGPAKFVHPSSLAPALVALRARVEVAGANGTRALRVADLYRAPANEMQREHVLAADEILTAIHLFGPAPDSATYEVRHRAGLDWPDVAAAAALELSGGKVTAARIVLGHVAPTPWSTRSGDLLVGKTLADDVIDAAARDAASGATPLSHNAYKVELVRVAVRRAILRAAGRSV